MVVRRLVWFLLLAFAPALAQSGLYIPAAKLGLRIVEDGTGANRFAKNGTTLAYVPGVGWADPLPATLPPPQGDRLPLEVVRAAGFIAAPEAGVRTSVNTDRMRLVVDLPQGADAPSADLQPFGERLQLTLPFFLPGLEGFSSNIVGLAAAYAHNGTQLTLQPPPGRLHRYRITRLEAPARLVLDVFYLAQEISETVAPGFTYREVWGYPGASSGTSSGEPVRVFWLEAAPNRWRLQPVGRPGNREPLGRLAPQALALLNGGYFDVRSATPIGLWVDNGVTVNLPFGRSTLFWDDDSLFTARPSVNASVRGPSGVSVRVGLNANRARYTAYTIPGTVGQSGEQLYLIQNNRVVSVRSAPGDLPPGFWALGFPPNAPLAAVGEELRLSVSLEPAATYALEAGPLLILAGKNVYSPDAEPFRDRSPLVAFTTQSAVAWTREGALWLVVTDSGRPETLAQILLERGAWGAIRMDAGSSAQLWIRGQLRAPSEFARPVVNGLAVFPR
ncbi:MAG: phosphodiester glycosidase family protein [Meiothermus sp.]|nr:phosphodiester glycosidase family protein [Meiothermus sp.]